MKLFRDWLPCQLGPRWPLPIEELFLLSNEIMLAILALSVGY